MFLVTISLLNSLLSLPESFEAQKKNRLGVLRALLLIYYLLSTVIEIYDLEGGKGPNRGRVTVGEMDCSVF